MGSRIQNRKNLDGGSTIEKKQKSNQQQKERMVIVCRKTVIRGFGSQHYLYLY